MRYKNFQDFIWALTSYWTDLGCIWSQPYDSQMGAGTFHPHSFLKAIGPEPWRAVYVQPCRRPVDGRYGKSTYRFQHYYQLQVLLKPAPANIVDLYLKSLEHVGICLQENDVNLLEDDWKGPTLGAWGLGWEARANGQEVSQFTYFQQLGGVDVEVIPGEITYGLERLFMYANGIKNGMDIPFNDHFTYGDIFYQNEYEFSHFNFKDADTKELFALFEKCEENVQRLVEKGLILPAYDYVLQASHSFNLLDSRGAVSVAERQRYIGRVRDCAKICAQVYRAERERLGFPMMNRISNDARENLYSKNGNIDAQKVKSEQVNIKLWNFSASEAGRKESVAKKIDGAINNSVNMLLEIGVEEMPPAFQWNALEQLKASVSDWILKLKTGNSSDEVWMQSLNLLQSKVDVSGRRLSIQLKNCPVAEPAREVEIWGPAERIARSADGKLTPAGAGFCRKNEILESNVIFKQKADGTFLYAIKSIVGRDVAKVFFDSARQWIETLNAPLKMKWLPSEMSPSFVRPVRWILALVDDCLFDMEIFGLKSGNISFGQRITHPLPFELKNASDYENMLAKAGVFVDIESRKNFIIKNAQVEAEKIGGKLILDESLAQKCAGLSESPMVFLGKIDAKYLRLPKKLVVSVLREHMNYFSVGDSAGNLMPYYIGVAGYNCTNIEAMKDSTASVVTGRLDDGAFYFDTDLEVPIEELKARLDTQLFQTGMGTLLDKSNRIGFLAGKIVDGMASADAKWSLVKATAIDAANLAKADLKSGCVQEFPDEMQGQMGGILVKFQKTFGERSDAVAEAISEHYEPSGAFSNLPMSSAGKIVSLADKLDSLAIMLDGDVDIKSNKDPFGLRRLAIGVLRLLGMDCSQKDAIPLSLSRSIDIALENLVQTGRKVKPETREKLYAFLLARLKASWKNDFDAGAVEAVCGRIGDKSLSEMVAIVSAASECLKQNSGEDSLAFALIPYRRSKNLTQELSSDVTKQSLKSDLFNSQVEKNLYQKLVETELNVGKMLSTGDYVGAFKGLSLLGRPMAEFFEGVMVNDDNADIKNNRLALLLRVRSLYESVADFSLIQV